MDLSLLETYFTVENIKEFLKNYRSFGPLPGILLPMFEAFLPILPLFLFVVANAAAYGFFYGSLLSWLGTCLGAIIVFWFFRTLMRARLGRFLGKSKKVQAMLRWVERHGFGPLFLMFCFPFTPSSLINVASGLSGLTFRSFLMAVLLGKMVMIFMVSYIGYDWKSMIRQPEKMLIVAGVAFVLWFIGKQLESGVKEKKKTPYR